MKHMRQSATALTGPRVPKDALTKTNLYAAGSHFGYQNGDRSPPPGRNVDATAVLPRSDSRFLGPPRMTHNHA